MNLQNMEWDEIVEAQGWNVETEYELAMDFIFDTLKMGEAYRDFLAARAKQENQG